MDFNGWNEALALLGGAMASAFAIARLGMAQHRALIERLMQFLHEHAERQAAAQARIGDAIEGLGARVAENTLATSRLLDRAAIHFRGER